MPSADKPIVRFVLYLFILKKLLSLSTDHTLLYSTHQHDFYRWNLGMRGFRRVERRDMFWILGCCVPIVSFLPSALPNAEPFYSSSSWAWGRRPVNEEYRIKDSSSQRIFNTENVRDCIGFRKPCCLYLLVFASVVLSTNVTLTKELFQVKCHVTLRE